MTREDEQRILNAAQLGYLRPEVAVMLIDGGPLVPREPRVIPMPDDFAVSEYRRYWWMPSRLRRWLALPDSEER